jgi:hypothetical protein
MIGQYLPNNNETATVAFRQKFCQLNSLIASGMPVEILVDYLHLWAAIDGTSSLINSIK